MIYRPVLFGLAAAALAFTAWQPQAAAASMTVSPAPEASLLQLVDDEREPVWHEGNDVDVEAPFTDVETRGRDVYVDAPFTSVDVDKGVRVQAPFVDIYIPRR
jgi:hypothetical protein